MKESEKRRGKSRMVINYKRLNDNTVDDAYNLPQKNFLIQFIQKAKIFSKFDLKSGFHQIAIEEESKVWTAFTTTEGHYEWNVMPFGLKNAPAVFQRRMDDIFLPYREFHKLEEALDYARRNLGPNFFITPALRFPVSKVRDSTSFKEALTKCEQCDTTSSRIAEIQKNESQLKTELQIAKESEQKYYHQLASKIKERF